MKDSNGHKRRAKPRSEASEIGRVRVFSKPGPDAEDRLRRLMSLMIRYATQDCQDAQGEDTTSDLPHAGGTATDGIEKEVDGGRGD
ncbi:MAG: hypothetical protein OXS33_12605 [bacterium]|nr:hypothetical protein [bacterium]